MVNLNLDKIAFQITLHGGNVKDLAHDALFAAKTGEYKKADELLSEAEKEYQKGHEVQSKAIQNDNKESRINPTLLLVHANDHLMAAKSEMFLIKELIDLYKKEE